MSVSTRFRRFGSQSSYGGSGGSRSYGGGGGGGDRYGGGGRGIIMLLFRSIEI